MNRTFNNFYPHLFLIFTPVDTCSDLTLTLHCSNPPTKIDMILPLKGISYTRMLNYLIQGVKSMKYLRNFL